MGRRRKKDGGYELLRFISLLGLYVLLSPDKKPRERMVRTEEPTRIYEPVVNQQPVVNQHLGENTDSDGDSKMGCLIVALIVIVLAILSESAGVIILVFLGIAFIAILNNASPTSSNNTQANQQSTADQSYEQGVNQQYAVQGSAQYVGSEQNVYARRSAQPFVPNPAKHVFIPDEGLADLLKDMSLSERMRYLNVDSVSELIEKFPTCIDEYDVADFREGEKSVVRAKRRVVADKYRYMPSDFNPNLVVPVAAAMTVPAAMYYNDDDDERSFFGNSNAQEQPVQQRPAWQDPYDYHGTEKYDEFYNLREDEYREEYGEDFEDAIDNEYEEKYVNK